MLNFDEKRFLSIQTGAVGLAPDIARIVGSVAEKGLRNLLFLGTGGAAILMQVQTSFRIFGYPGLAMLCFLAAATGGFWLVTSVFIQDRRNRRR